MYHCNRSLFAAGKTVGGYEIVSADSVYNNAIPVVSIRAFRTGCLIPGNEMIIDLYVINPEKRRNQNSYRNVIPTRLADPPLWEA